MGNTIRRNADMTSAERSRAQILADRRTARRNRAEESALDSRAILARIAGRPIG